MYDQLFKNAFFMMLAYTFTTGFGFIFWILAAKFYPASDVGIEAGIISSMNLIVLLSRLGLDFSIIRFFPTHDKNKVFNTSIIVSTCISLLLAVIFIVCLDFFLPEATLLKSPLNALFYFISITASSTLFMTNVSFVAIRKAKFQLYQDTIVCSRVLFLILFMTFGAIGIFYAVGTSFVFGFIVALFLILKSGINIKPEIDRRFLGESFKFSAFNYLSGLFMTLPNTILQIMILNRHLVEQAAYYYLVSGIVSLLIMIPNSVSTSLFVEGSNGQSLEKAIIKALITIFLFLTPIAVILYLYGYLILGFIGPDYISGGFEILRLMIISSYFVALSYVYFAIRRIEKDVKEIAALSGIIFILLLGFGYILLPVYGIIGIGYAWIISYGVGSLIIIYQICSKKNLTQEKRLCIESSDRVG